jgi:SAM-dependent methyltransferase
VVSNAVLQEFEDPEEAVRDFARVCRPGGEIMITLPLAGTYAEFHDIFREVLIKGDHLDAIDRLDAYLSRYPPLEQAEAWLEDAGLVDIRAEYEIYTLLFKSSREFFFAPVIEYGPLPAWKEIAGKGQQMQHIFWQCKSAIDTYFRGSSFAVTIVAGCIRGKKSTDEHTTDVSEDDVVDEEVPTRELELVTDEIDIVDAAERGLGKSDDDDEPDEPIL